MVTEKRLYMAGWVLGVPGVLVGALETTSSLLSQLAIGASFLCFAAGFFIWVKPLIERTATSMETTLQRKVLLWALKWFANAVIAVVVVFMSRLLVGRAIGLPPTDFDFSVAAWSIVFFPLAWALLFSVAAVGVVLLPLVVKLAVKGLFSVLLSLLPQRRSRPKNEPELDLCRVFGAVSVLVLLALPVSMYERWVYSLTGPVLWFAYYAEYHELENYPKLEPKSRARVHENGVVSYAKMVDGVVTISVDEMKCNACDLEL
jgi:hypothetical protein